MMKQSDEILKRHLVKYAREIARRHLVMGAMGNISAKGPKALWIKRAGAWLERARPQDFIALEAGSARAKAGQLPSKEVFLHLGCYRQRPDIGAVVHTHPLMATALATAGISLAGSARLRRAIGSPVAVVRYYPPGSRKLAAQVRRKIKQANALLLAGHGLVTVGRDIREACRRSVVCEEAAKEILRSFKS